MPAMMLKNVVLPAPFGPIRLTIDPLGIVKLMSWTATRPRKRLVTWVAWRRSRSPWGAMVVAAGAAAVTPAPPRPRPAAGLHHPPHPRHEALVVGAGSGSG